MCVCIIRARRGAQAVGPHRTAIRFSPNGAFGDMGSADFRETFTAAITEVGKRNLAYVHLVDGIVCARPRPAVERDPFSRVLAAGLAFGFHNLGQPFTLHEARQLLPRSVALIGNCGCVCCARVVVRRCVHLAVRAATRPRMPPLASPRTKLISSPSAGPTSVRAQCAGGGEEVGQTRARACRQPGLARACAQRLAAVAAALACTCAVSMCTRGHGGTVPALRVHAQEYFYSPTPALAEAYAAGVGYIDLPPHQSA